MLNRKVISPVFILCGYGGIKDTWTYVVKSNSALIQIHAASIYKLLINKEANKPYVKFKGDIL